MNFRNPIMSRFRTLRFVILSVILLLPVHAFGAEEPLVWKFAVGDEHPFRMNQQMNMAMNLGEAGEMKTSISQKIDLVWQIESIDDKGIAALSQHVRRVQMEMQAPGQIEIKYDTDAKESPLGYGAMIDPVLKALVATPLKLTMTPRGEITSVEIPEKISQAMKGVPGAKMMANMVTEQGYKTMMQQMALILPQPADLSPGHAWSTTTELLTPPIGKITTHMTFTYKGPRSVEDQVFEVFVPKLELEFGDEQAAELPQIKVNEQNTSGEFLFNRSAGRLESSRLEQEMTLQIAAGDRQVEQKMVQKVELKRMTPERAP